MAQIGALPGGNLRTGRLIVERAEERDLLKFLDLLRRRCLTGYPLMVFVEINDISSRGRLALDLACTRKSFPQRRLRRDEPSITRTAADRFKMDYSRLTRGIAGKAWRSCSSLRSDYYVNNKRRTLKRYCIRPRLRQKSSADSTAGSVGVDLEVAP